MIHIGVLPLLVYFALPVTLLVIAGVIVFRLLRNQMRKGREAGYPSLSAYLRAAPRTDEEKRDAADLALKGLVVCLLGALFPPLLLLGLVPLFYGTRKVVYASMGLGLLDDSDHEGR